MEPFTLSTSSLHEALHAVVNGHMLSNGTFHSRPISETRASLRESLRVASLKALLHAIWRY